VPPSPCIPGPPHRREVSSLVKESKSVESLLAINSLHPPTRVLRRRQFFHRSGSGGLFSE